MSEDTSISAPQHSEGSEQINPFLESGFAKWLMREYDGNDAETQEKMWHALGIIAEVGISDMSQLTYCLIVRIRDNLLNRKYANDPMKPWANATKHRVMASIKTVIKKYETFCLINNVDYPLKFRYGNVQSIKLKVNNIRPVLSEREVLALIESAKNSKDAELKTAWVKLAYFSACRNNEVNSVQIQDIHEDTCMIDVVDGKGGKSQSMVVEEEAIDTIMDYLNNYRLSPKDKELDDIVFISRERTQLRDRTPERWMKQLAVKSNIERRVYPHILRGSNATHRLMQGWDIYSVKEHLRHSSVKETEKYVSTAKLLAQANVEIGLINLRPPPFQMTRQTLPSPKQTTALRNNEKIDQQGRYINLLERGLIDQSTFKSLIQNLSNFTDTTKKESRIEGYH